MEYVSRSAWGARAPESRSNLNLGQLRGVAVHYEGADSSKVGHDGCDDRVRAIQRFHMDTRGWADIAYNWLVCRHGVIFEGRGWGIRSAANGTNDGNASFHAVCYLDDDQADVQDATPEALSALALVIRTARSKGWGSEVKPHSYFKATACPGNELRAWISSGGYNQATPPPPAPQPPVQPPPGPRLLKLTQPMMHGQDVKDVQTRLNYLIYAGLGVDGVYGPATAGAVKVFQADRGLAADGIVGPNTRAALAKPQQPPRWYRRLLKNQRPYLKGEDVKVAQRKVRATADGVYGPRTAEKVRGWQAAYGLAADGIVGPKTATRMGP